MDLETRVQFVKGIGPQRAESLEKAGVRTVLDLLFHLPLRYEDRRAFAKISALQPGMRVSVAGEIVAAGLRRARRMSLYEVRVEDGSGRLKALWFNQPYLRDSLVRGKRVVLFGTVERDAYASRQLMMSSPEAELIGPEDEGVHTGRLVPVYEKLGPLSGKALRRILARVTAELPADLADPL
ncbi:MAG TPA: OB-fold nucleic acid binding domain-containing protein, partial [Vicinamibacteria bacterium]